MQQSIEHCAMHTTSGRLAIHSSLQVQGALNAVWPPVCAGGRAFGRFGVRHPGADGVGGEPGHHPGVDAQAGQGPQSHRPHQHPVLRAGQPGGLPCWLSIPKASPAPLLPSFAEFRLMFCGALPALHGLEIPCLLPAPFCRCPTFCQHHPVEDVSLPTAAVRACS